MKSVMFSTHMTPGMHFLPMTNDIIYSHIILQPLFSVVKIEYSKDDHGKKQRTPHEIRITRTLGTAVVTSVIAKGVKHFG
jgi:hypothetical protein